MAGYSVDVPAPSVRPPINLHKGCIMSMKKSAVLLACVGAWALVVTGPSSVASPPRAFQPNPGASPALTTRAATASSLPVGDADPQRLTSKNGGPSRPEPIRAASDERPAQLVGIIVRFRWGAFLPRFARPWRCCPGRVGCSGTTVSSCPAGVALRTALRGVNGALRRPPLTRAECGAVPTAGRNPHVQRLTWGSRQPQLPGIDDAHRPSCAEGRGWSLPSSIRGRWTRARRPLNGLSSGSPALGSRRRWRPCFSA